MPATASASRPPAGLGVGYCGERATGGVPPASSLTPADRLAAGEPRLASRGARVTVHGLLGGGEALARLGIRAAELRVGFPIEGGAEFRAWSYQLLPVENAGAANAFAVPVDDGLVLALVLESLFEERYETVLSTGREPGRPKLRAGSYLLAPGPAELLPRRLDPAAPQPLVALAVEPLI